MRHLTGVVLAIVMAAAVFFAASWGYLKLRAALVSLGPLPPGGSLLHDRTVVEGFGALLAAGLVAGILIAVPQVSPLASGLPGLALLAWTGLYLDNAPRAVRYIPLKAQPYGAGFEALLFNGVLALAGLAMVIPLFVPSRWRRRRVAMASQVGYRAAPYPDSQSTSPYPDSQSTSPYLDSQSTQTLAGGSAFTPETPDWSATATTPQPPIDPSAQGQAPWGPADYS